MKIRGMHVDGYGRFTDFKLEQLSPGLTVFLGQNEAGKSTLLAFIRAILFGFPDGRKNENRYTLPGRSQHGGRLFLEDEAGTDFILHRHAGKKGGLVQIFVGDKEGDHLTLQRLLGSAGRELFKNVFAFSLGELQQFETLNDQEVTSALYSAGLGTSAAKLGKLEKDLKSQAEELFKPSGSKPAINALLKQLEDLKIERKRLLDQAGQFGELARTLETLTSQGEEVRMRQQALIANEIQTEKLLSAWPTWARWSSEKERLGLLPSERSIPPSSLARHTTLLDRLSELQQKEAIERKRLEEQNRRREELPHDSALLGQGEAIRRLAGHRTQWDNLRQALPGFQRQENELHNSLRKRLTEIHPDWNVETLESCDISVGRHAAIKIHQATLSDLNQEQALIKQRLAEASKERQIATHQLDESRAELSQAPAIDPALEGLQESELSDLRSRWRQSSEQARRAEQEHRNAARSLADKLDALGAGWTQDRIRRTEIVRDHSQKALGHREVLALRSEDIKLTQNGVQVLEKEIQVLRQERETLSDYESHSGSRSAEQIEALRDRLFASRADLLRREGLQASVDQARAQTLPIDSPHQGLPDWLAGAIVILGVVVAIPLYYREETHLALFFLAVMLLLAVSIHRLRLASVARTTAGVEDAAKHQEQAREQLGKAEYELAAVEQRLGNAASFLGLTQPITSEELDRLDRSLLKDSSELQRCLLTAQQVARLDQKLAHYEKELALAKEAKQSAVDAAASAEKDWRSWLTLLELPNHLMPDAAREMLSDVQRLADLARSVDRLAERVQEENAQASRDAQPLVDLLHKAGQTLRAGDFGDQVASLITDVRAEAERVGNLELLKRRVAEDERRWTRAEELYHELSQSLEVAQASLALAEEAWNEARSDLQVATPDAALEILQRAQSARELLDRAQAESSKRQEAEDVMRRMYEEVCGVFSNLGRQTPSQADLTSTFDRLLSELQHHEKAEDERVALQRETEATISALEAVGSELSAYQAELSALYAQAEVQDATGFTDAAEIERIRAEYLQEKHVHELALTVAAGGADFSAFVQQLESSTTEGLQLALNAAREEREQADKQKESLLREQGRVQSELDSLQDSDALPLLRMREEILKEELRVLASEWAALALADKLLEEARKTFERERQPDVLVRASAHFSRMTDGRYARLIAPPGDSKVVMETATGVRRETHELSRGTAEQAYLALRLGFVHEFSQRSEPLPLVMDDIFVNFDPERAKAAMSEILTLTDRHQVLLFTCHPETVARVLEVHPAADVRELKAIVS